MAFDVEVKSLKHVRIILKHDPALDHEAMKDTEIWSEYVEDPLRNEGLLKFKEGKTPTVFICNFEVSGKEGAKIKNNTIGGADEDKNPTISYGSWGYAVVRIVLKEIENPGLIKFKKDSRGYVDEFTMSKLEQFKCIDPIFDMYIGLTKQDKDVADNAKN